MYRVWEEAVFNLPSWVLMSIMITIIIFNFNSEAISVLAVYVETLVLLASS